MKMHCLIFPISYILLFTSCKVESQKVVEKDPQEIQPVSAKDLAAGTGEKLNPDEAVINVSIIRIEQNEAKVTIYVEVIGVENRGFGFKSNLNKGDKILIRSGNEEVFDNMKKLKCLIREVIVVQQGMPAYQLIKLIEP